MKFLSLCKLMLMAVAVALPMAAIAKTTNKKEFTLVVDPGHGGKDIGATDNNAREKDINLGVAKHLEALVKKKMKDAKIVMTRDGDTYLTLQQRADIANKAKGDLFISIHTNSVDKSNKNRKTVAGSSVYALGLHKDDNNMAVARRENSVIELESNYEQKYSGFDPLKDESYIIFEMAQKKNLTKSIKFAEMAQKQLTKAGRVNRGVHQAGFWVLWATSMPAVLVELDFICNPTSAKYLTSEKGQKELAEAIFKAIESYYDDWKQMQGNAAMTKSMAVAAEEAAAAREREREALAEMSESNDPKVKASSKAKIRRGDKAPAPKATNNTNGKRRRRSDAAKLASASRSVETADIPLHTTAERAGKSVQEPTHKATPAATVEEASVKEKKQKGKGKNDSSDKKKEKKEKQDNKKRDRPANSHNAKIEKFVTVYKIQVLASADLLKQNNPRFRGLSPITTYKENNLYKYYFGETDSQDEINAMLKEVKKKIPDAFIVTSKKMMNSSKI